jgi:hypothetical protein
MLLTLFLLAFILTIAIISCILTTIFKHHVKVLIMKKFQEFDLFISCAFNLSFDNFKFNLQIKKTFLSFLAVLFTGYFIFGFCVVIFTPSFLKFLLTYIALTHFCHVHDILLIVFVVSVERRLKILTSLKMRNQSDSSRTVRLVQISLIMIYDLIELINEHFRPYFIQSMFLLYLALAINFFWLGYYFLGFHHPSWIESSSFLLPNIVIIFYLASYDRKIKKTLAQILKYVIALRSSNQEEFLLFLLKKKFQFGAFHLVNIGYSTLAKANVKMSVNS